MLLQFAQEDQIDSLRVGKKTLIAVETILKNNENKSDTSLKTSHYDKESQFAYFFLSSLHRKRLSAGLNPITLLAEHKRKVILNAMTEGLVTEIQESRSKSQEKLANYLEDSNCPEFEIVKSSRARVSSFAGSGIKLPFLYTIIHPRSCHTYIHCGF